MSCLKKHWRFTVPAIVVLSTLLIGVVVLYSTSEPPEPKTVYTMPERSTNNPPLNKGGVSLGLDSEKKMNRTELIAMTTTTTNVDNDTVEPCCGDESQTPEQSTAVLTPEQTATFPKPQDAIFKAGLTFSAWDNAVAELRERQIAHDDAVLKHGDRFLEILRALADNPSSFQGIPELEGKSPDEIAEVFRDFNALFEAQATEHNTLARANQVLSEN